MKTALLVFILLLNMPLRAATDSAFVLDSVVVIGAASVADPQALFDLKSGRTVTPADADRSFDRFKETYDKAAVIHCGFLLSKNMNPVSRHMTLTITVAEKEWVKSLNFTGNQLISSDTLVGAAFLAAGSAFHPDSLAKALAGVRAFYKARDISADIAAGVLGGREKIITLNITEHPETGIVVFRGNRFMTAADLFKLFRPAPGSSDISGLPALQRAYQQQGFFDCAVRQRLDRDTCAVEISEGTRLRFLRPLFSGNEKIPADTLLFQSGISPGNSFSEKGVLQAVEALLRCYEDRGYPFAEVRVEDVSRDASGILVRFGITEGLKIYFGRIFIKDSLKTKPAVMERLLKIPEGAPFSQALLDAARERLLRCGLFEDAAPLTFTLKQGRRQADIQASLKEAAVNSAEGVLGYQPREGKQGGFSGYVDLVLKNMGGTMRAVRIHYLKEYPLTDAEIYYLEPWVLKTNIDGEFFLTFRIDELDYTFLETKFRAGFPVRDNLRAYAGLSRSSSTYRGPGGDSALITEYTTGSHAGVALDLRDFPENPRRGFYANLPLSIGIKSGGEGDYREFRPELFLEGYVNPIGPHVLAMNLHYAGLVTDDTLLQRGELLPLGGAASLRGYRESQFYGKGALSLRNEYRYLLGKRGRGLLFADLGLCDAGSAYFRNSERWDALLFGYGAGLFLRTPAGYAGVDYGLGRGDGFLQGKVHLLLKNTF